MFFLLKESSPLDVRNGFRSNVGKSSKSSGFHSLTNLIVALSFEKMEGDGRNGGCAGGTRPFWGGGVRLRHSRHDPEYVWRRGRLACPRLLPPAGIVPGCLGMGYAPVPGAADEW